MNYRLEHRAAGWRAWRVRWYHLGLDAHVTKTFRTREKAERFIERRTARDESQKWREVS